MPLAEKLKNMLLDSGVCDVGFACLPDGPAGLTRAVSIVVPLSQAVLDEIGQAPTHSYYVSGPARRRRSPAHCGMKKPAAVTCLTLKPVIATCASISCTLGASLSAASA